MNMLLIILLVLAMIWVVISLVRGIVAFLQTTKLNLEQDGDYIREMQLKQNRMMFARIKYQALAIVIIVVIMMVNQ
jgi:hypothetical protein